VAAVVGISTEMLPGGMASMAPYASGWLFWMVGFGFSRAPKPESPRALPVFSILALWLFTWKVKPLALLLTICGVPLESKSMWFGFYGYDFLIPSLVLLMVASERRPSITRFLIFGSFAIPVLWTFHRISQGLYFQGKEVFYDILVLSALALIRLKPSFNIFFPMAWFGSISYAVYIFQRPVQFFIRDASWIPSGSVATYVLRVFLIVVMVVAVSWWLEKRLQPKIKQWLTQDSQT
jgi:peptidoglycan/LPS O-acetylase OafA/YrhL